MAYSDESAETVYTASVEEDAGEVGDVGAGCYWDECPRHVSLSVCIC